MVHEFTSNSCTTDLGFLYFFTFDFFAEGLAKYLLKDLVKHLESLRDRNCCYDSNASDVANENVCDCPPKLLLLEELNRFPTECAKCAQTTAESGG
jgi:hypothetical protein